MLASSREAKAIETLCLATGRDRHRLHIDDNFGEVQRVEPFDDHHHSRRLAWVRNELDDRHIGWETPSQAAVRFQAGLDAIDDDVVVATHGMVMTAWLVARGIVEPGPSAGACWIRLTVPASSLLNERTNPISDRLAATSGSTMFAPKTAAVRPLAVPRAAPWPRCRRDLGGGRCARSSGCSGCVRRAPSCSRSPGRPCWLSDRPRTWPGSES